MIVYSEPTSTFRIDADGGRKIAALLNERIRERLGISPSPAEIKSWQNSLQNIHQVLKDGRFPNRSRVSIEYGIQGSSKRIDLVLSGSSGDNTSSAVIVELKQWSDVQLPPDGEEDLVSTFLGGSLRPTVHPSYQANSYEQFLKGSNQYLQDNKVAIRSCAYLHNLIDDSVIRDTRYKRLLDASPAFLRFEEQALSKFLLDSVPNAETDNLIEKIEGSPLRPSKELAEAVVSMLDGNQEFVLLDAQKVVFEKALKLATTAIAKNRRQVIIVSGGPGTGKSVVAINLLAKFLKRNIYATYVTKTQAPRAVYSRKLAGHRTQAQIANLFKGSSAFHADDDRKYPVLIIDEAHRLVERSQYQPTGTNQISNLISSSLLSIFFIDEKQQVSYDDIGSRRSITEWAAMHGAEVTQLKLESQFRCNGSNGYLDWVDMTLGIQPTPVNGDLPEFEFDIRVADSASAMKRELLSINLVNNKTRMVAGYCWPWISRTNADAMDIVLDQGQFEAQWNLTKDGGRWLIEPNSFEQVGCIHTSQGLELDYVGVIIGPDLVARNGQLIFDPSERDPRDRTVNTLRNSTDPDLRRKAEAIVQNTYRTLMTRGMKGCILYSEDQETREYFKAALAYRYNQSSLDDEYDVAAELHPISFWTYDEIQLIDRRKFSSSPKTKDMGSPGADYASEFAVGSGTDQTTLIFRLVETRPNAGTTCLIELEQDGDIIRKFEPLTDSTADHQIIAELVRSIPAGS